MANEIESAIKNAAASAAQYVRDAAVMVVETRFVEIGGDTTDFSAARPGARTVIKLDGDCETVVPMRPTQAGPLEVDSGLFALHQQNVNTAIEYRARILNAVLGAVVARTHLP